jgi:hypothetical protein
MINDDLTPSESAILIVLMAEDREIANSELKKRFGLDVRKENREKLIGLRYVISTQRPRAGYFHVLDDKGWQRVQDDLNFINPRARALGAALTLIQENLRERVLPRVGYRSFAELFSRNDIAPVQESGNLEVRLRNAYEALATEPGSWVALARLRPFFDDVPRADVDEALRQLGRAADVNLVPENNQKVLTDADRAAAVHLGGQDKHLLAIGV